MKRLLLFSFIILLTFAGCYDNDDFAPYECYAKKVAAVLTAKLQKLSDVIPEIDSIAHKQQKDLILTSITMTFEGEKECTEKSGTIIFGYAKPHDTINQVSTMNIYYVMSTHTVEKFHWEKGHGKRVNVETNAIGTQYTSLSIDEIFACFDTDSEYLDKLAGISPFLNIRLDFNRISVALYDRSANNRSSLFRYDAESAYIRQQAD